MYSKDLKDKRGRIKRKELSQVINREIFKGEEIKKDSQIRNIITHYTNIRKKYKIN